MRTAAALSHLDSSAINHPPDVHRGVRVGGGAFKVEIVSLRGLAGSTYSDVLGPI